MICSIFVSKAQCAFTIVVVRFEGQGPKTLNPAPGGLAAMMLVKVVHGRA